MHVNIVAELCCNHCGSMKIAEEMITTAKECGADYVKMQKRDIKYMPEEVKNRLYEGQNSFGHTYGEHRKALEFSEDEFLCLKEYAANRGIGFFATPFDILSLEFIHRIGVPYIKFGSTQIYDVRMIDRYYMDEMTTPVIMSTGMSSLKHINEVYEYLNFYGDVDVIMQTTSSYPCDENNIHLRVIKLLKKQFPRVEIGLSGHYVSGNGAIEAAAVAIGATWIERHFTLDRTWKGSDQASSLEPEGLKNVVKAVRSVERALGEEKKEMLECEEETWKKIMKQ